MEKKKDVLVYSSGTKVTLALNNAAAIIIKVSLCYNNIIYVVSYMRDNGEYTSCELYDFEFTADSAAEKKKIGFH